MRMETARITGRTLIYDGWYRLHRLEVTLPGEIRVERHLLDNGSAVAVLPFDPVRRVATLITQPRAAVLEAGEPPLLEAIAGGLDGASPEERIVEESMEEAGLRITNLQPVTAMWSLPPISTERVHLFLAEYAAADRIGPGGGAEGEHEAIEVHEISLDALRELALSGRLTDAKTLILAQTLLLTRPDLWG